MTPSPYALAAAHARARQLGRSLGRLGALVIAVFVATTCALWGAEWVGDNLPSAEVSRP